MQTMSTFFKRRRLWVIAAGLLLLSGCLFISGMVSDDEASPLAGFRVEQDGVNLHVLEAGSPGGIPLVLIHGTPGSAGFFSSYLRDSSLQDLRLLAIDRPGWGDSQVRGNFDATLASQSALLGNWLCQLAAEAPDNRLMVLAHSYGATLTPRLLMEHPGCISAALLLAGAADPALAEPRWYNRLAQVPPVSWLTAVSGLGLRRSNQEMLRVKSGLEEVRDDWDRIDVPVTVIQGEDDMLVHPDHADYLEQNLAHLPARVVRIEDDGHMIVHSRREYVISELRSLLGTVSSAPAPVAAGGSSN